MNAFELKIRIFLKIRFLAIPVVLRYELTSSENNSVSDVGSVWDGFCPKKWGSPLEINLNRTKSSRGVVRFGFANCSGVYGALVSLSKGQTVYVQTALPQGDGRWTIQPDRHPSDIILESQSNPLLCCGSIFVLFPVPRQLLLWTHSSVERILLNNCKINRALALNNWGYLLKWKLRQNCLSHPPIAVFHIVSN